jgi:transposase
MRIFSEEQATLLDANIARSNLVVYSQIVSSLSRQNDILVKKVEELSQFIFNQEQRLLLSQEMIEDLKRAHFARSSERRDGSAPLFDTPTAPESTSQPDPPPAENASRPEISAKNGAKPRKGHGRTAQPELPVVEVKYTLSEEEMKARGLVPFEGQYEVSELVTFEGPKITIEKSMRQKYFGLDECGNRTIVTAPGPLKLIEKSRYSLDFSIQTGLDKYDSHLPLSRQVKRFKEWGLSVKEQALYDQIDQIAWNLKPHVVDPIHAHILSGQVALADDTWWRNLDEKKKFYLWAVANERAASFVIYDSRSQKVTDHFLGSFRGTLVTDGHHSFKPLSAHMVLANDWSHVRRKFVKAEQGYPVESKWFIDKIRDLFDIERGIKGKSAEEIFKTRQELSRPITEEIFKKLVDLKGNVLPKGRLGKAVTYALNLWSGLTVFLKSPLVPMNTNLIERLLRSPVVGRKAHYGSRTIESARVAAIWYTVIATCHLNNVNPRRYIKYALTKILAGQKPCLPWEYTDDTS